MFNTKLWLTERQLGNKSPQKRLEAVQKLRAMEGDGALAALLQAAQDSEAAVRIEACHALGEFKNRKRLKR